MDYGLWTMDCGFWANGPVLIAFWRVILWTMDYGLWILGYGRVLIAVCCVIVALVIAPKTLCLGGQCAQECAVYLSARIIARTLKQIVEFRMISSNINNVPTWNRRSRYRSIQTVCDCLCHFTK